MSHACHCSTTTTTGSAAAICASQTVAEVAQASPGALDAMKRLGINHCCGAQLTLAEAAAAAGVPLDVLLGALQEAQTVAP
jgi:regulator of cell morphogenesis and NO signaling